MNWRQIPQRIRTVIIFAPIPLLMLVYSPLTAWIIFAILGVIGLYEWRWIILQKREWFYTRHTQIAIASMVATMIVALYAHYWAAIVPILASIFIWLKDIRRRRTDLVIGQLLISFVVLCAYWLRSEPNGLAYFGLILVITVSSDSAAYFVGRAIGRHKFAPNISPNKTWEGAVGGWIFAIIFAMIYSAFFLPSLASWPFIAEFILFWLLAFVGQMGDLGESALKRKYGVKDSGDIFPGHGGVLDRFDSFATVILVLMLIKLVFING